jgi:hypothetical protein
MSRNILPQEHFTSGSKEPKEVQTKYTSKDYELLLAQLTENSLKENDIEGKRNYLYTLFTNFKNDKRYRDNCPIELRIKIQRLIMSRILNKRSKLNDAAEHILIHSNPPSQDSENPEVRAIAESIKNYKQGALRNIDLVTQARIDAALDSLKKPLNIHQITDIDNHQN